MTRCGHGPFCQYCIRQYATRTEGDAFPCPFCRARIEITPEGDVAVSEGRRHSEDLWEFADEEQNGESAAVRRAAAIVRVVHRLMGEE